MKFENKIFNHVVEGIERTCIRLGNEEYTIPRHMMQGEKMASYIYQNEELKPIFWYGFQTFDGYRHIYFDKMNLDHISCISTKYRSSALKILNNLASALLLLDSSFISLSLNIIPLWRFYIIDEDTLLILSPDLSDLFSVYMEADEKRINHLAYVKQNTEESFSLLREFGQLLYYSLSQKAPYADDEIRQYNFKEVPIFFYQEKLFKNLDRKTVLFIDFLLNASSKEQRSIMGNNNNVAVLQYFIDKTRNLSWNVDNLENKDYLNLSLDDNSEYISFKNKKEKGAARNNFWRKKGAAIITITITSILVICFLANYLYNIFKPPITEFYSKEEIIISYFDAVNTLDVNLLTEAIKGTTAPHEMEVINLFVTNQTRSAYEQLSPLIKAEDWKNSEDKSIDSSRYVYGTSDLTINKLSDNKYRANYLYYNPYPGNDEEITTPHVYIYEASQDFTFEYNSRGWWNIVEITDPIYNLIENIDLSDL